MKQEVAGRHNTILVWPATNPFHPQLIPKKDFAVLIMPGSVCLGGMLGHH